MLNVTGRVNPIHHVNNFRNIHDKTNKDRRKWRDRNNQNREMKEAKDRAYTSVSTVTDNLPEVFVHFYSEFSSSLTVYYNFYVSQSDKSLRFSKISEY